MNNLSIDLMPLLSYKVADFFNEDETLKVRYLTGSPRQYRFNMSNATVNLNGTQTITQPKDDFIFAPFAYRFFEEALFGKEEKIWVEFFFLNKKFHVCSIMFHGYTAQSFRNHFADFLFYEDLTPCEVMFTVRPEEKKAEVEENGKKVSKLYHIGAFKSTILDKDTREANRGILEFLPPIYREDTYKENRLSVKSEGYKLPFSQTAKDIELKGEEVRVTDLLAEFDKPSASQKKGVTNMLKQKNR